MVTLINTVLNFFIVAFVIFWVVKSVNILKRLEAEKPSAPPAPSAQENSAHGNPRFAGEAIRRSAYVSIKIFDGEFPLSAGASI